MCRLFAYKGSHFDNLTKKLLHDENSLLYLSKEHPDGWGIAHYQGAYPQLIKSALCAKKDKLFNHSCDCIKSPLIVAHIRRATTGAISIVNTHPFQHGPWIFAHNGHIINFEAQREKLRKHVAKDLRCFILGTTDSELCFYLILTLLKKKRSNIFDLNLPPRILAEVMYEFVELVTQYIGPLAQTPKELKKKNCLTFVFTNGRSLVGYNGGKELFFHAKNSQNKKNKHSRKNIFIASVPTDPVNSWHRIDHNELIIVDQANDHSLWHLT